VPADASATVAVAVSRHIHLAIIAVAGLAAGIINGVAGGGTLVTFPTLLGLGLPAITANVSSSIGILPGYLGAIAGFRAHLRDEGRLLRRLLPLALLGGLLGAVALLITPPSVFASLVVVLVAVATTGFALQPVLARRLGTHQPRTAHAVGLAVGVFATAIYGGYFGAAMGILLLVVLGLTTTRSIATTSGVRASLSLAVNLIAAAVFCLHGTPDWAVVATLAPASALGGVLGAKLASRVAPTTFRLLVVGIGATTCAILLAR
jgi:uncharacterized membrane protein YfcA